MKYFKDSEFNCKCCGVGGARMDSKLLIMLDRARELAKIPFTITSGYRCEKHNKEIGGKEKSSHLNGLAVDIATNNSRERLLILKSLVSVGFNRIGIAKTFIHIDIDKTKDKDVAWLY